MMPSRVIREGLLDSPRYWSVTIEARQLFWHLMLLADDLGCINLAPVFIRRRCFDDGPPPAKIDSLLQHLSDADLLRIYIVNGGRYGYIPRFGQRLRIMRSKFELPPENLYKDDPEARDKFNAIIEERQKMPASSQSRVGQGTAERKGIEEKRREGSSNVDNSVDKTNPPNNTKSNAWWKTEAGILSMANSLHLTPAPGESYASMKERAFAVLAERKKAKA